MILRDITLDVFVRKCQNNQEGVKSIFLLVIIWEITPSKQLDPGGWYVVICQFGILYNSPVPMEAWEQEQAASWGVQMIIVLYQYFYLTKGICVYSRDQIYGALLFILVHLTLLHK